MIEAPPSLRDVLIASLQGFYQPRSSLTPWQWHEEEKTFLGTQESQDYSGDYDSSLAPQNRFIMEFVSGRFSENIEFHPNTPADAVWREMVVMKSSQVGVTLAVLLAIVWWIAEIGKNVIYAIDSEKEARRISTGRLQPLIKNCPAAASKIQPGEEGFNDLTIFLLGMIVYILGGGSSGEFQNKTATLAVLDEADHHPTPGPGELNNLDELRARLKAVTDAKIISISRPKTESDLTAREHKTGTQHVCVVPCPHCGDFQELVIDQLRYDHCKDLAGEYDLERVKRETYYECSFCHRLIEESNKREMMLRHRWRQTNPSPQPGKLSIHESDLYSQFPTSTWGHLAVEYIAALKSIAAMTRFRQERLGKPERLRSSELRAADVLKLRAPYHRRTIPVKPVLVGMGVDVQGDVRKWVKGGFSLNGELRIIDWGYTLSFDDILEEAAIPIPVGLPFNQWPKGKLWEGDTVVIDQGAIDEGHMTETVRRFCLSSEGLFVPTKGRGEIQVRHLVSESEGEIDGEEMITYHFSDSQFKKALYVSRIAEFPKILAGKSKTPRMYLPWEVDAEFADELTSERLVVENDRLGFPRELWKKNPSIHNDFGDALKNLLVIWYWLGPQIVAEAEQQREEEKTSSASVA